MSYFIHDIDPIILPIGNLGISWYGTLWAISFILGYIFIWKNYKKKNVKITKDHFETFMLHLIIGVVIGGRLGYIVFYQLSHYLQYPLDIFAVWKGGMSFHGGAIGAIIACFIFCRR